jgi:hypothetical protein
LWIHQTFQSIQKFDCNSTLARDHADAYVPEIIAHAAYGVDACYVPVDALAALGKEAPAKMDAYAASGIDALLCFGEDDYTAPGVSTQPSREL